MSKLVVNYDNIRNNSVYSISLAIKKLNTVISSYNNLNIPYNYSKRYNLNEIKNDLITKRNQLNDILNWIINSNNEYTRTINNLSVSASKLPKTKFGQRRSF